MSTRHPLVRAAADDVLSSLAELDRAAQARSAVARAELERLARNNVERADQRQAAIRGLRLAIQSLDDRDSDDADARAKLEEELSQLDPDHVPTAPTTPPAPASPPASDKTVVKQDKIPLRNRLTGVPVDSVEDDDDPDELRSTSRRTEKSDRDSRTANTSTLMYLAAIAVAILVFLLVCWIWGAGIAPHAANDGSFASSGWFTVLIAALFAGAAGYLVWVLWPTPEPDEVEHNTENDTVVETTRVA